jgi:NAD-dependent deacetylase sirtuin 1
MFDYHVFLENPDIFYSFAKEIYPTEDRSPTFAHRFIAELEKRDKLVRNYTQNIDTLEDLAGISKVFRCHGGFDTARCITCGNKVPGSAIKEELLKCEKPYCQFCSVIRNEDDVTHGLMKPDIVFFHESLPDEFSKYLMVDVEIADLVIVMGSSLQVAPVSSFTKCFPPEVPIVLINMERIYHIGPFTASLLGDCQAICCYLAKKLNWDISDVSKGTDMIKTSDPVFYHPNFEFVFNYKPINEKRSLDYLSNEENLDLAPQQIISKYDSEYVWFSWKFLC